MAGAAQHNGLDLSEFADFLRGTLWGCWRFRWPAIALAWALCVAGWVIVTLMPDIYRASARVYVDTQSPLRPLLAGLAVNSDVLTDLSMQERALMSRPRLAELAKLPALDIDATDPSAVEAMVNQLQASIQLEKDGKETIRINYENHDPRKALAVVQELLNTFVEKSLGDKRTDSGDAEKFLVDRLREYEGRLNTAEQDLSDFKRKNVGLMPGEGSDYYGSLQTEQGKLQDIDGKLRVARNRRVEIQRQIEGEEPVFGLVPSDDKADLANSPQDRQIAQFEQQLAELRLKYTETHPDIVQIKKTIADLRAEKADAAAKAGGPAKHAYSPVDLNPVYQQMKLQLSQVDVELAQLQTEYADQAAVVGALRRKVDTVPAIEAEMKRLTRNYDVTKTQYDELLRRLESARMSEAAEQSKNTFKTIDPPMVPSLPAGPPRALLMTGVLLFALIAAFAVTLALNLMRPVFYTGKDLERRFGVPVLGAIRLVRSDIELAVVRQKTRLVAISMGALVLCYGLLVIFAISPVRGALGL
jgi:polysaccharide chain length determinant protein (PEP-CTERM system associated)